MNGKPRICDVRVAAGILGLATMLSLAIVAPAALAATGRPTEAQFGIREDAGVVTVDTGAGLVFKVRERAADGSARGAGDLVSITYDGVEFQDSHKGSQVNSGFSGLYDNQSGVDVRADRTDAGHVKVTVRAGDLVHYYMARQGDPVIYMATWFAREPKLNLVRYIARLDRKALPDGPPAADIGGADRLVEAHDIFGLANGETRSKHYSNMRLKDWRVFGARGRGVGAYMVRDDNEGGSGGPFYRSLLDQGTATDQELTYIVNYGEVQTEPFRIGVLDGYALVFTHGAEPGPVDTSWFAGMALQGYVGADQRGGVSGAGVDGMEPGFDYTIGFANAAAQYWTPAASGDGRFRRAGMRPGTYRMTVYKNELAVASRDVDVVAGRTAALGAVPIDGDPDRTPAIWRIGRWDGTPTEFLNGERMTHMHPSDARMAPWATAPFVVGKSSTATDFPACQWADVNSPLRIRFTLSPAQVAPLTLRIGVTVAFANGRPTIQVNDWKSATPAPSLQPTSRSLTVGSYRGNNHIFAFAVPASALKVGENELRISVFSGKGGTGFLSAGLAYDAIDLIR